MSPPQWPQPAPGPSGPADPAQPPQWPAAAPSTSAPQPQQAPPQQQAPSSQWPGAATPTSPSPQQPWGAVSPASAPPNQAPQWGVAAPAWEADADVAAGSGDAAPSWQPRIAPSPPATRSRLMLGVTIGLIVGVLAGGVTGFFVARGTEQGTDAKDKRPTPTASASTTKALPPYEASRLALNKAKLNGDLADIGAPWLSSLGGCVTNTEQGGPKLNPGEKTHVFCRYGGAAVHFIAFSSPADRDSARLFRQRLNLEAHELAPGVGESTQKAGGNSKVMGRYVEYAYRDPSDRRAFAGIWWDRDDKPVAVAIEGLWDSEFGGSWDPLRDLWQRFC